jgi:Mg2+ and Co2+ transporter CorA
VVRADGSSRVFDDALTQAVADIRSAEERLRQSQVDGTTLAIERMVVDALAEMIAAVDESLDELEKQQQQPQQGAPQSPQGGDQGLVSQLAELRMIRSIQARLMRQTEVWRAAAETGEAPPDEVSERLAGLADEQRKLAAAAEAVAGGAP